jgi:preprotein translocase subunit SecG
MAAIAIVTLCVVLLLPRTTGRGLGTGADEAAARAAD